MRVFKARRTQLFLEVVGGIVAVPILVLWKGLATTWFFTVFLFGFLAYRLFLSGVAIKTVTVRDDGVGIVPLFPWFKRRQWQSDSLATYKSVTMRDRPIMGILTPKEGKHEVI